MHSYYPEVTENLEFIQKVIANEENRFQETIHDGLAILETVFAEMKEQNQTVLSGENAFKLYDTYGFPYELTLEYASDNGYEVDEEGFQAEMKAQKERARAARNTETSMNVQSAVLRDITVESTFVGYDRTTEKGLLSAIVYEDELVSDALRKLILHEIDCLPVVRDEDGGKVIVGKISKTTNNSIEKRRNENVLRKKLNI